MIFDRNTLSYFLALAETGSFTEAAKRVCRSQSAISQQMAKLHAKIGKPLFKKGKNIQLTPEGELFLHYAKRIKALQIEALDHLQEPELHGDLRFGLPEDFASVFLSDVLAHFAKAHPRIRLNIECDLTLNLLDRFQRKDLDLILVKMDRPENFPNSLSLWSQRLRWAGDPELILEEAPLPLVLSPQPCIYRTSAIKALEDAGRSWRLVLSSPSYAGTMAAVKASMGLTVMPDAMLPHSLQIRDQHTLPPLGETHISLLKQRNDHPGINSLAALVQSQFN